MLWGMNKVVYFNYIPPLSIPLIISAYTSIGKNVYFISFQVGLIRFFFENYHAKGRQGSIQFQHYKLYPTKAYHLPIGPVFGGVKVSCSLSLECVPWNLCWHNTRKKKRQIWNRYNRHVKLHTNGRIDQIGEKIEQYNNERKKGAQSASYIQIVCRAICAQNR